MKCILFDLLNAQPAATSKFHGGGEYVKTIFGHLVENYSKECKIITFYNKDKFIDNWIINIIDEFKIKAYDIKDLAEIKKIIQNEKIDIYYSGLPYSCKKEYFNDDIVIIGTIHGLRNIEVYTDKYTHLYSNKKRYLINKIRTAKNYISKNNIKQYLNVMNLLDKIICDSEHSRYSICNFYPEFTNKDIQVFYVPQKRIDAKDIAIQNSNNQKYILILGGDRWIKNSYRAIRAIDSLYDDNFLKDYKVKIVGKLTSNITKKIHNKEKFEMLDYVNPEELESLYQNCDFFLYPTLNEGFGLPPLEAMKYGKTCIVSAVCSLPEICGDAVYYINPYDIYEIRNRILRATKEKIPEEKIKENLEKVNLRQKEDLDKICQYIINSEKRR